MSDKPIDPDEVEVQGETYRQLTQEQIEENVAKLLNLAAEGGTAACREFYDELKAKGYQSQQITCSVQAIAQSHLKTLPLAVS